MGKRSRKKRKVQKARKFKKKRKFKKRRIAKRTKKKTRIKRFSKKNLISKDAEGNEVIKVSEKWSKQALVNRSRYQKKYNLSIKDNDKFWKKEGKRISWIKPYTKIKDVKYSKDDVKIRWFYDGTLNASANCIDRHLKKKWKENCYNLGRRRSYSF